MSLGISLQSGQGRRTLTNLALAVVPVIAASWIGATATAPALPDWYPSLAKPWFTPPNWAFPVAWTTLFGLMAWATFRILQKPAATPGRAPALLVHWSQLGFNVLWSFAFFYERSPLFGLIVVVPFLALVILMVRRYGLVDRLAGRLLWPYPLWVGFAAILNFAIWRMN